MNVSLLVPDFLSGTSFLQQPLDLLYVSSVLENQNWDVSVVDCRVHHMSIRHLLRRLEYADFIVVSTTPIDQVQNYFVDFRYAYTIKTIKAIRFKFPNKTVIVYGAHLNANKDFVYSDIKVNYYIFGELIYTLPVLLNVIRQGGNVKKIPNIAVRIKGRIYETVTDYSLQHPSIPNGVFPDYSKVDMEEYYGTEYINNIPYIQTRRVVVQGGRGCPYSCSFCHNYFGKVIKYRSAEQVAEELELCYRDYGIKEVFFLDEVFTLNKSWVKDLLKEIVRRDIKLKITVQTRVDCINDDLLTDLKLMGVENIWLGVESMSDDILAKINKGTNVSIINEKIKLIRSHGIQPLAFFMIGNEGESRESLNILISNLKELEIPYTRSIMICTPRFNTPLGDKAVKQYPNIRTWFDLHGIRGLVNNELEPMDIMRFKDLLRTRLHNSN